MYNIAVFHLSLSLPIVTPPLSPPSLFGTRSGQPLSGSGGEGSLVSAVPAPVPAALSLHRGTMSPCNFLQYYIISYYMHYMCGLYSL